MQKNKAKNKKIIFPNNQGGKIAALILAIIILVVIIWGPSSPLASLVLKLP